MITLLYKTFTRQTRVSRYGAFYSILIEKFTEFTYHQLNVNCPRLLYPTSYSLCCPRASDAPRTTAAAAGDELNLPENVVAFTRAFLLSSLPSLCRGWGGSLSG